jgi:1-hydroxycarotenoid 3,4-desaturase
LHHHNVFFDADPQAEFDDLARGRVPAAPTLYLCAEDRGLARAPGALERFEIITNAPAASEPLTPTDRRDLTQWHQTIMRKMEAFNVTFTPTPTQAAITTPQHFAQMFPASQGALYGQSPHGLTASLKRPRARTNVTGLWLCGGGTHPGAGVPMATISARHAAEAILNDRTSTSKSARMATHGGTSTA